MGKQNTCTCHDLNWGALNHASHAPQLLSCNYYVYIYLSVCACVYICVHVHVCIRVHVCTCIYQEHYAYNHCRELKVSFRQMI